MVWLTAAGILATVWIAFLAYRANKKADASRRVADGTHIELLKSNAEHFNASVEATRAQTDTLTALVERLERAEQARSAAVGTSGSATEAGPDAEEPAPRRRVNWLVMRDLTSRRGRWSIQNTGTDTAFEVTIEGLTEQDQQDLYVPHAEPIDVDVNGSLPFSIDRSLASPPATVLRIKWREADGTAYESRIVVS